MTVHLLIIEDEEDFIDELYSIIDKLPCEVHQKTARSRDEAYSQIAASFLDLVILDLTIPTVNGALDADPEHGHAVFNRIRVDAPGTPIFVLTGSPVEDFIPNLLANTQKIDIWSEGKQVSNIFFQRKYRLNECVDLLQDIVQAIEALSDVELDRGDMSLSVAEDRLIRIFAKKFQGVRCVVSSLSKGLSGARVVRLKTTDRQGVQVHEAVAKLAGLKEIRREAEAYDNFIIRLNPISTARKFAKLEFGAHNLAGVFFALADGFEHNAFESIRQYPSLSNRMIKNIEAATEKWVTEVPETRRTIKQFRQRLVKDDTFEDLQQKYALDWSVEFEEREIQARWACIHGDLHGCNVLVSSNGSIVLIDYSDVGEGPASLDPITLEMSVLFHPESTVSYKEWLANDQVKDWGDLDRYLTNCPVQEFVSECRQWAFRVAAGRREVAASAYAYLIRQLGYDDTNKELAMSLLKAIRQFYNENT